MRLTRMHERTRGAKVTSDANPEGCSPEITVLDMADNLGLQAGNKVIMVFKVPTIPVIATWIKQN